MDAETLNAHLRVAREKALTVEAPLTRQLEKLLRSIGDEAAERFEQKVTRFDVQAAAVGVDRDLTMIAVYPHPDQAAALAQTDGQTADTLHVTLAFLGSTTEAQFGALVSAVHSAVALEGGALEGSVGGCATFAKGTDGYPSILLPDVPGLAELRHHVAEAAAQAGIDSPSEHGWTPHLTLAYTDTAKPPSEALLGMPLSFDRVSIVRGNVMKSDVMLTTAQVLTASADWHPPYADEVLPAERLAERVEDVVAPRRHDALAHFARCLPAHVAPTLQAAAPKQPPRQINWSVTSPFFGQALTRTGEHIARISKNVRADVMSVIDESYAGGLTVADTAAAIRAAMDGSARSWAETIARTELNRLANDASLSAVELVSDVAGVGYTKVWMTAPGAPNPRHELDEGLDGQEVELDGLFQVGADMLSYPGDPDGSPEETINCRCSLSYNDKGGGEEPPPEMSDADLAGGAALTSTDVSTRIRPVTSLRSARYRRRDVRAYLTAAGIAPTYPLTHGSLGELRFYEAVEQLGYTEIASAWWPTEVRALNPEHASFRDGDGVAVYMLPSGEIAYASIGRDSIRVTTAAKTQVQADGLIAMFRHDYPASFVTTEGDSKVPITFWSMSSWGPQPHLRRIESASWADIERNYTASVRTELGELMSWTEPPNAGQLLLWQGEPGTGKTWALRALASEWSDWAEFHFITDPDAFFVDQPSYMIDVLLSESYSAIDSDGAVFEENDADGKWRVLILEDTGELLSADAKERYGQGLSRLLNVVDGMIGQGLKILALVTTNDELGDLNDAALRPGRLASQIVFSPLDPSEAAAWLGSDVEEGLTVAELYARTKTGTEALADDSMQCAECEHTYADHPSGGACSVEDCSCKSFDDGDGDEAAQTAALALATHPGPVTVNLPGGITMTFDSSGAGLPTDTVDVQPDAPAPVDASMVRWTAVLAPEGRATDDGRIFAPGSISWRETPLTLMGLIVTEEGGHSGAEVCGRIDRIWRDESSTPILIRAEGVFDSSDFGKEIGRLVGNKVLRGNSVDLAVREYVVGNRADYIDEAGNWIGNGAPEADLIDVLMGDEDLIMVVTDGVIGMSTVCPFPAFEDGEISLAAAGVHFMVLSDTTNLRWNVRTSDSFSLVDGLTASAAGLVPVTPPREWFEMEEPDVLTALTVTEDGQVYGHAWTWNECHIGIANKCTIAPHTQTDYGYFLLKEVEVALDTDADVTERIHCGTITLGTNHAGRGLDARSATEHYDNSGTAVADVVVRDGKHGGWFCGALRPDVSAERVRELRGGVISGDWRSMHGNLELVGLLTVNVPGFPVPRTKALVAAASDGSESDVVTLIAAGKVLGPEAVSVDEATKARLRALSARAGGGFEGLAALARGD